MSYTATNFKEWYEDKYLKDKGEFDKLAPDDQKKIKEEFGNFDDVLKYMDKSYAEYKGFKDDARKKYDDIAVSLLGKNDDDRSQLLEQAKKNLTPDISSGKAEKSDDTNEDTNWIKEKIESWNNNWCQDKDIHDPEYTFDRITEDVPDTQLKFNIYKDAGKTQLGATIHYTSKTNVTLETEEGKVPDFEFFDKMIHEAVQDGAPAVNFANADEMTDDFKAKLAIACLRYGIQMEGFDDDINLELLNPTERASLDENLVKKVDYYNLKNAVKECKAKGDPVKISPKEKKVNAAMLYAAAKELDVPVEGFENFTKDSHGMFTLPAKEKELLPKEVQDIVNKYNHDKKEENIEKIREKTKNRDALPEADRDTADRFNDVYNARQFINTFNKTDDGKKLLGDLIAGKAENGAIIHFVVDLKKQDDDNGNNDNMMALFGNETTFEEFTRKINAETKADMFRDIFKNNRKVLQDEATKVNEADKDTKKRVNPSFYAAARDKFLPR